MTAKKLTLRVQNPMEFQGKVADIITVDITLGLDARIRVLAESVKLAQSVRQVDATSVCKFFNYDDEDHLVPSTATVRNEELHVRKSSFYWTGNYGTSELAWRTEPVRIFLLDEKGDIDLTR